MRVAHVVERSFCVSQMFRGVCVASSERRDICCRLAFFVRTVNLTSSRCVFPGLQSRGGEGQSTMDSDGEKPLETSRPDKEDRYKQILADAFGGLQQFMTKSKIWPEHAGTRKAFLASPLMQNLLDKQLEPTCLLVLYLSHSMFRSATECSATKSNPFVKNTLQQNMDMFLKICKEHTGFPSMDVIVALLDVVIIIVFL
jgi:hypothetical protein